MSAQEITAILSGEQTGLKASLLRGGLSFLTPFYRIAVAARNYGYDSGLKRTHVAGLPVISIGNITTGGTGKTPLVAWVVNELIQQGHRPSILSRGYRSLDGQENDEKRLLDQLCPGVPHVQNPDRVSGAQQIKSEADGNVIVLDDGYQHRRLLRDLDIVLIDALNPWGYGRVLPRGLLREPKSSLRRASMVVITRTDQIDESARSALRVEIERYFKGPIAECAFEPTGLVSASGRTMSIGDLDPASVAAFSGIGNPGGFRRTLCGMGCPITDERFQAFPDHHHYSAQDLEDLATWVEDVRADTLLTTRKDLVKIPQDRIGVAMLWGVEIGVMFRTGEQDVLSAISRAVGMSHS